MLFSADNKVFLVLGRTDMRKAMNGLTLEVAHHEDLDALSDSYFVFCNAARTIIKILYWERNVFSPVAEAFGKTSISLA